ncbi:Palmitoyltransferase zdhhc16 [Saguinus oedipus]|uniref:Palmitoyltransferase zdhhc16 n=1 Tax=Saguinus oedipus TaxID=9490 RepID=A0ABQ9THB6_SAGOE|nr:Palmitoyltransferase zdhhc16 [Saguinus oedipus]
MQYLTGGAIIAAVPKPGWKRSRLLVGQTQAQFRRPMRGQRSRLLGPARLCLRLLLPLGCRRRCPPLLRGLARRWHYGKVCLRSLFYDSFEGNNVIRWFGVVFVVLVIVLTGSIVAVAYLCVLPLIL